MTRYETVCVVRPDVPADRLEKVAEKIRKVLSEHKSDTVNRQDWGVRKLAYPIKKFKTGHYLHFVYSAAGNAVGEMERQLNYDDAVLRYLTLRADKKDAHIDVKPDNFQFGKIEAESYSHPFGGGPYGDRRERFDRGDRRGFDRREPRESQGRAESAKPKSEAEE